MAIRCVSYTAMPATEGASVAATNVSVPRPGVVAGDLVLAVVEVRNATVTITGPSTDGQTWTAGTALQANNITHRLFWCIFDGIWDADPNFSWVTSAPHSVVLLGFEGVDNSTPIDASEVSTAQAAAATYTNGASFITTVTNNAAVVHGLVSADNNTWGSFTAGSVQPYFRNQWTNANTTGISNSISYVIQANAGGSASFSGSQATLGNDAGLRWAIALRPASAPAAEDNFAQAGHFATTTSATPVSVTTPATPKLVIAMQTRQTADGAGDGLKQGIGILARGHQRALYVGAVDNTGFGNSVIAMYRSRGLVNWDPANPDADGSAKYKANFVPGASGFDVTATVAAAENALVSYLALGGDDIEEVTAFDFVLPIGTGSVTYNNIANFTPDFVILPNTWNVNHGNGWDQLTTTTDTDEAVGFSMGVCDSDLNQGYWMGAANSQGSGATTGSSLSKTGAAFAEYDSTGEFNSGHDIRYEAVITALGAGSVTMNYTTVSGTTSAANLRTGIAVKLSATGKMRVVSGSTPTSAGDLDITADVGSGSLSGTEWLGGVIGCGCNGTGGTSRAADELLTMGVFDADGNNEAACWWYDEGGGSSGSVPTDDKTYRTSAACFAQRSASSAATEVGTATATDLSGQLTLTFSAADATAHTVVGFLYGPAPAAAGGTTGTAAFSLPAMDVAAEGTPVATGTAAPALPAMTVAASGRFTVTGTAAPALPAMDVAAAGSFVVQGSASVALPAMSVAASGHAGLEDFATGTADVALPVMTVASSGSVTGTGAASVALPAMSVAASGSAVVTGSAAFSLPAMTVHAHDDAPPSDWTNPWPHKKRHLELLQ